MTETIYEYAIRECAPKASVREQVLNDMARDGWELVDLRAARSFEWSSKDQVTFRRATN